MLISFEGGEGAGKTTQIRWAADYLEGRGHAVVLTREPGGTPAGAEIRATLLAPRPRNIDPMTELLLYMADRAEHLAKVIEPAIAAGKWVLCDRYVDATAVYQGAVRGLGDDLVDRLHRELFGGRLPDRTFLLDLPAETGLGRASLALRDGFRSQAESRFEAETLEFHQSIRRRYLQRAREAPERFRVIDADADPETVRGRIIQELKAMG